MMMIMFKTHLKIAWRHLWKNKRYAIISIGGLAIGLAGFILILMYIDYELSYDKWLPHQEHIYQGDLDANFNGKDVFKGSLLPPGMTAAALAEVPGIKNATHFANNDIVLRVGNKQFFPKYNYLADSSFFDVFSFPFLYGDSHTALDKPHAVVLSEQLSQKLFGNTNPVGKTIVSDKNQLVTVTGVLKHDNRPTHLKFDVIASYNDTTDFSASWSNNYTHTYFLLNPHADPATVQRKLTTVLQKKVSGAKGMTIGQLLQNGRKYGIYLQPISTIHLNPFWNPSAGRVAVTTLIAISLLGLMILIIAAINFTNLAIAQAGSRAKEVGLKKVMGSSRKLLGKQFLTEFLMQCLTALFISLIIIELCIPLFNHTLDIHLALFTRYNVFSHGLLLIGVIILITLLSGLYPAFFLTGFQPAKVLKGNYSRGTGGISLRRSLLVVQLFIAVLFLTGTTIIFLQIRYMQKRDLGFRPDQVITFTLRGNSFDHYLAFKKRMETVPGVTDVSRAMSSLGDFNAHNSISYDGENYNAATEQVGFDYFRTLGIETIQGRVFSPLYGADTVNGAVLNESAVAAMHLKKPVGASVSFNGSKFNVIGVVKNFQYRGVDKAVSPLFFFMQKEPAWFEARGIAYVKINATPMQPAILAITKIWNDFVPAYDFRYRYADKIYASILDRYTRQGRIFLTFALLNILLAFAGLYALATFLSRSKTREIGVRKVLGASDFDILKMLNKDFIRIVLIANVIAWPVTYLLAKKWLDTFPYRIAISPIPLAAATIASMMITILTVSIQARRAVNANPVDALKYE
jgi:putative ABC transport system permease protein